MLGWCMTGHHGDDCKKEVTEWHHGTRREGRKTIPTIVVTGIKKCDCKCHTGKKVKMTTKTRRKK